MIHVLAMAGAAHVAVAGAIAMVTLLVGIALAGTISEHADVLPGLILLGIGLVYVVLDLRANGHLHHHHHDVHEAASGGMSDRSAIVTLVLTLALSPCEAMVPVFVSAAPTGDPALLLLLVVVSGIASVGVMGTLAWMAWHGSRRVGFGRFARRERLVVGLVLAAIGAATLAIVAAGGHA
jgi:ABC-type nickel/cobalt efflux system permease component RcnA